MIIELNGSGSEPTHIYDPAMKLWQAWKIIIQHWKIMYQIAAVNHKRGVPYLSIKEGRKLQKMESLIAEKFKAREKLHQQSMPKGAMPKDLVKAKLQVVK
jgi:hypothetical protein